MNFIFEMRKDGEIPNAFILLLEGQKGIGRNNGLKQKEKLIGISKIAFHVLGKFEQSAFKCPCSISIVCIDGICHEIDHRLS